MDKELIKRFLGKENSFAVVGVSRDKKKYGYKIYKNLKEAGYKVYPVNPNCDEIDGCRCYHSLEELPEKPDLVDIVVPPAVAVKIAIKCRELGIKKIWLQPGSESKKVVDFCNENKIEVVCNVCVMLERKNTVKT